MIFSSPPQFGQCSRSSYNRRLSKRAALTLARWLTHPSAAGGGRLLMAGSWWSRAAASRTQNLKEVGPGDGQLRRNLSGGFGSSAVLRTRRVGHAEDQAGDLRQC